MKIEEKTLAELLGIKPGVTAIIGSGGKTTAMYTLAEELRALGRVLCTTTTHIFPAEHLPVLRDPGEGELREMLARFGCVCAGSTAQDGKLGALPYSMDTLCRMADYILVEADGSRGLPGKAHAPHEPVIPSGTGRTLLVVGASAFGRSIREVIHRPEVFCRLTGAKEDELVTPRLLGEVICRETLADVVLINQVESAAAMSAAQELAAMLPCPVVAGSLKGRCWRCL